MFNLFSIFLHNITLIIAIIAGIIGITNIIKNNRKIISASSFVIFSSKSLYSLCALSFIIFSLYSCCSVALNVDDNKLSTLEGCSLIYFCRFFKLITFFSPAAFFMKVIILSSLSFNPSPTCFKTYIFVTSLFFSFFSNFISKYFFKVKSSIVAEKIFPNTDVVKLDIIGFNVFITSPGVVFSSGISLKYSYFVDGIIFASFFNSLSLFLYFFVFLISEYIIIIVIVPPINTKAVKIIHWLFSANHLSLFALSAHFVSSFMALSNISVFFILPDVFIRLVGNNVLASTYVPFSKLFI